MCLATRGRHVSVDSETVRLSKYALIHEALLRMREFSQLVSYHVLRNSHWDVVLPVVHEKTDSARYAKIYKTRAPFLEAGVMNRNIPNEIWEDGARTRICFYRSVV